MHSLSKGTNIHWVFLLQLMKVCWQWHLNKFTDRSNKRKDEDVWVRGQLTGQYFCQGIMSGTAIRIFFNFNFHSTADPVTSLLLYRHLVVYFSSAANDPQSKTIFRIFTLHNCNIFLGHIPSLTNWTLYSIFTSLYCKIINQTTPTGAHVQTEINAKKSKIKKINEAL